MRPCYLSTLILEERRKKLYAESGPPFCPAKKDANTVGRSTGTDSVWLHVGKVSEAACMCGPCLALL